MRMILIFVTLLFATPTLAAGWTTYANARYGATAEVPPGFEPMGPEATNSDGLIFRSHTGAILTIFGAPVPGGDFEAFVNTLIEHDQSYNGWKIINRSLDNNWAEFTGSIGGRFMSMRVQATCKGHIAIATKFEYSGSAGGDISRVEKSLKAGPANAC